MKTSANVRHVKDNIWSVEPYYNGAFESFWLRCSFEDLGASLASRGVIAV